MLVQAARPLAVQRECAAAPRWATAIGAWGDAFAAYGNVRWLLRERGLREIGMLHYGADPQIARFLALQEGIREVRHVRPPSIMDYTRVTRAACANPRASAADWLPEVLPEDIPAEEVALTHITAALQLRPVLRRWHGGRLPEAAREWAREMVAPYRGTRLCLLHPFSEQSARNDQHWRWWREAVCWLLAETEFTFLLTGLGYDSRSTFGDHPRLINLVNSTPGMMHVLALAEECGRIVCTSNSLSMWGVIQGIPAVTALTSIAPECSYYHLWIDAPKRESSAPGC